jgi:UDP-hydrolysing UDP-N-acetyl-D-glucosamine 2-epimerase
MSQTPTQSANPSHREAPTTAASKRTIAVVTSSRADYSHLYWPLRELDAHPGIDLKVIVFASHLSPEFGHTVGEIERDSFPIAAKLESLLSSDTDIGMAKSIGLGVLSLADTLGTLRPDLVLLIADRYEMLAPASVALALRIPIAHIEGGEISQGAIDDAVRNALTKLSHIHFTSTPTARQRVIALGEEPWRVHHAGAPSLDHLRRSRLLSREELQTTLNLDLTPPSAVVAYHPVTLLQDTLAEAEALFAALAETPFQLLFCYPNADAGSRELITRAKRFLDTRGNGRVFVNLPAVTYWSLLRQATVMIGNSSSGIMETGSFALPTVDIGLRQAGRERGPNILHADPDAPSIRDAIRQATSDAFRQQLQSMQNPYGDGHAAERIVSVLASLPARDTLLFKQPPELP